MHSTCQLGIAFELHYLCMGHGKRGEGGLVGCGGSVAALQERNPCASPTILSGFHADVLLRSCKLGLQAVETH